MARLKKCKVAVHAVPTVSLDSVNVGSLVGLLLPLLFLLRKENIKTSKSVLLSISLFVNDDFELHVQILEKSLVSPFNITSSIVKVSDFLLVGNFNFFLSLNFIIIQFDLDL